MANYLKITCISISVVKLANIDIQRATQRYCRMFSDKLHCLKNFAYTFGDYHWSLAEDLSPMLGVPANAGFTFG